MKFLLFILSLFIVAQTAPPIVTKSEWRNIKFDVQGQPISMTAIQLTFDQDLYVNVGGTQTLLSNYRDAVGQGGWPAVAYRLQGSLGVTCSGVAAKKYDFPSGVPQYILSVPPTDDPVATFFGYFAGFFLKAQRSSRTWPFMLLHEPPTSAFNGQLLNNCLNQGTLQIHLFPSPCRPDNATVTTINNRQRSQWPHGVPFVPPYKASDLFCSITNQGREAIGPTTITTLPTRPTTPVCNLAGVNQLKADITQLRDQLPLVKNSDDLNGIDFAELAITLRLSYQGCLQKLNEIMKFKKRTRNIGSSTDCPDRTNQTSVAFLSNPCCNYREGRCCGAQTVSKTFEIPFSVNNTALDGLCPGGSRDRLIRRLLRVFTIARNLELKAQAKEDMRKLFSQLFWNVWSECRSSMFSQRCSTNAQCYSRTCDVRQGWCRESPTGQALPMIRCLIEKYDAGDGKLLAAFQDFADIQVTGDLEQVAQGIFKHLQTAFPNAQDCVGPNSWAFKAKLEYKRDPSSGAFVETIVPANRTGCLQSKRCNWNPYSQLNEQQCLTRGGTPKFCGLCGPGGCQELSQFPLCRFSYGLQSNPGMTPSVCSSLGGTMAYSSYWSSAPECLKLARNATGNLASCFDSICPGPNSPSPWIAQQFLQTKYNGVCGQQVCYNLNLNQTECWTIRSQNQNSKIGWDRDWRNGVGLCVRHLDWNSLPSTNMPLCSGLPGAGTWMYFPGAVYQSGEFYTQQLCSGGKVCELPNTSPFSVGTDAACTSQSACDRTCPDCVQNIAAEGTIFCATNFNQTTCRSLNARFDTVSQQCLTEVPDAASCAALAGTIVSCRGTPQATCGSSNTSYQATLSCRWRHWASCLTPAACNNQGECDDWDLYNGGCSTPGGCPICVYPFANDADGRPILRCGVPIVNGYPCENCGQQGTQENYRHSRFGCILNNQAAISTKAACESSAPPYNASARGIWVSRASTQAACVGRSSGCVRFGGWYTKVGPTDCAACGGQPTSLYRWAAGRQLSGRLVNLQWLPRGYNPENEMITTVPVAYLQRALEEVVARFLATIVTARISASYDLRFNIYGAIIERCNNPNANVGSVRGIVGVCRCFRGNRPCQGTCPYKCPKKCRYTTLNFIAAIGDLLSSRRRLQAGGGQPVHDGSGAQVGVFVGDAWQLNGTLNGTIYLCVPDNVQYTSNISASHSVPDFAPTLPGSGLPGIPLGLPAIRVGTSTCANVTVGNFGLYPILRTNMSFVSATKAPSMSPSMTPSMSPTMTPTMMNQTMGTTSSGNPVVTTASPPSPSTPAAASMFKTGWFVMVFGVVVFTWMQ